MNFLTIKNNQRIPSGLLPMLSYGQFRDVIINELMVSDHAHCVNYYGYDTKEGIRLICCIADDREAGIHVLSALVKPGTVLEPITPQIMAFHVFEREIHENFGIEFRDHPWLKPVRYPYCRPDKQNVIGNYPFYAIDSEELHEVGVGPVHAGVIEPGHFRFICNGEQILHLEIQLGYQHRGIENLFLSRNNLLQRTILAENIAGDSVVAHTSAFVQAWESLCGFEASERLQLERALALEIERIAIHTGDLSALATDIAYQLGSSVFGRLRTPVINFFQEWCGNRFAKSLIRPGKSNFPLTDQLKDRWKVIFNSWMPDFLEMGNKFLDLPSVLSRLEKTGVVTRETAAAIGAVGMAARASGLERDIRSSHPYGYYSMIKYKPVLGSTGDVFSRARLRFDEIVESTGMISEMIGLSAFTENTDRVPGNPEPDSFVVSLAEGWRGEICHCAITGESGELVHYKIKDPSLHNWMALALAVRNNEISDFPVCNKSFNLSYCGHDL